MAFFRIFVAVTLALALLATPAAAAAVEETNTTATDTPASEVEDEDAATTIDANTRLVKATYHRKSGFVTLILESERPQVVTVTDAGGVFEGGEITRKNARLLPGKNRVRISVTEVQGNAAVTLDTGDVLYGIPVRRSGANPLEKVRATSAWIGGVVIAVSMFTLAAWREMRKEHGEPVSGWEAA